MCRVTYDIHTIFNRDAGCNTNKSHHRVHLPEQLHSISCGSAFGDDTAAVAASRVAGSGRCWHAVVCPDRKEVLTDQSSVCLLRYPGQLCARGHYLWRCVGASELSVSVCFMSAVMVYSIIPRAKVAQKVLPTLPTAYMYAYCVRGCFQIATSPRELDCIYCLYVYVHTRTLQCLSCFQGVRVLRALRPVFDRA